MEFVQGLPKGVYVGQTCIEHPQAIATPNQNLKGFNLPSPDSPQTSKNSRGWSSNSAKRTLPPLSSLVGFM